MWRDQIILPSRIFKRLHFATFMLLFIGANIFVNGSPVSGATGAEVIHSFVSQVDLSVAGTANITETIQYDFGDSPRHGIYRTIPTTYHASAQDNYYLGFKLIEVSDEAGRPQTTRELSGNGKTVIKIGDADRTLTGSHTYVLHYTLAPIVTQGTDYDQLLLNVTGNEWQVPIEAASVVVSTPNNSKIMNRQCYTGIIGSTTSHCKTSTIDTDNTKYSTDQALSAGEGLTVSLSFAKGAFSTYLKPNVAAPLSQKVIGEVVASGLALLFALSWPIYQWRRGRKLKRQQVIIPQYEPPDELSPAEIGTIDAGVPSMKQVSATIIDLAVRGYMRIEQVQPAGMLAKANYRFVRLKSEDGLREYEKTLYGAIFKGESGDSVELNSLDRRTMSSAVNLVKDALSETVEAKGYYRDAKRPWWWITGMALIAFAFIALSWVASLLIGAYAIAMLTVNRVTDIGAQEWAKVGGFKWFLRVTEQERLKFSDAPSKTPEHFNKLLPYAVALGVEQQWAKQFEGMDIAQSSGWYVGSGGIYTPAVLAGSLASDFSSAVSTGFAAPSSSGSGGFSGGGFGGGGGGSW